MTCVIKINARRSDGSNDAKYLAAAGGSGKLEDWDI